MKDYPVIKLALGLSIGILVQKYFQIDVFILISIIILSTIIIYLSFRYRLDETIRQGFLIIVYISLGTIVSYIQNQETPSKLKNYHKEKNSIAYGKIEKIDLKKNYEVTFILKTDSIIINNRSIITSENLLCRLRSNIKDRDYFYDNFYPGNKISFISTFTQAREIRNPGEFDYRKYLYSKGITGILTSYQDNSIVLLDNKIATYEKNIFEIRKHIDNIIHKTHNEKTAGLLRGLLLADRSQIDSETKLNFINAGVIHILAVSGLHVGYILLFLYVVFGRFNFYLRSIVIIIGIFCFMLITGIPASVFRATLMASIIIIAFLTNRSTNILNSIALSAVIILSIKPQELFNPGFQLSYSAVLSIALIYPVLQKEIENIDIKNKTIKKILLFAGVSLCAQLGTLPFTVTYFNKISLIALIANLIVIPLTALIVGLAIITTIIGTISTTFASFLGISNNFISALMFNIINISGGIELSHIRINNYSLFDGIIFYFFISIFIYGLNRLSTPILKILFTLLIIINIYIYSLIDDKELLTEGKLNILMIDVDQGDSFLIKFPNNQTALIDAGMANPFFDMGEKVIIPLLDHLGIKKIDYGFISHFDNDHYGGFISLILNNRIKEVYLPEADSSIKSKKTYNFLNQRKIPINIYNREKLTIGNTAIYFLNDTSSKYFDKLSSNDKSAVMKIVYGEKSFLFVADIEYLAELYYVFKEKKMLDADVLKVAHHGSKTSSSTIFLEAVSPQIALISAGVKNKYHHPSDIVLERLKRINSQIIRTDSVGAVLLQSDGKRIIIIDWRKF